MKPEDRLLLTCLRQNFTEAHIQAVSELARSMTLDWERIVLTAEQHDVSGLINWNLSLCPSSGLEIPDNALRKLKLSSYKNALIKERQKERLVRALSFFRDRGLEVMLIKGAALDLSVYENPNYVLSNDIDIMIHARREDYSNHFYKDIETFLHKQGIEFQFYSHHDMDINGLLPIDYESIWEQAQRAEFYGFPILLLSPIDSLISLCINSSRKRYFRLKSLCDIHESIQIGRDISWQQLGNRAHAFQCENIVFTAFLVTLLTTGCNLPLNWAEYFNIHPIKRKAIRTAVSYLLDRVSFYPYPFSGKSFAGRTIHFSLVLPYLGYKQHQIVRKISYAARNRNN